jgi:hypothetical protein
MDALRKPLSWECVGRYDMAEVVRYRDKPKFRSVVDGDWFDVVRIAKRFLASAKLECMLDFTVKFILALDQIEFDVPNEVLLVSDNLVLRWVEDKFIEMIIDIQRAELFVVRDNSLWRSCVSF